MRPITATIIGVVLIAAAAVVLKNSLYVVNELEFAVVTQFGEPRESRTEAGIFLKTPFVQTVRYLPKRIIEWKGQGKEMVTKDKTYIWANTWARWRIVDPLKFYQALRTESNGQGTLDDQIESATKTVIASHDLVEVVRNSNREMVYTIAELKEEVSAASRIEVGRREMCRKILEAASKVVTSQRGDVQEQEKGTLESVYGIRLIDVQISRVIYVQEVQRAVYDRMSAERHRIAQRYRSEGAEEANQILGAMQKELLQIESEGKRRATELRGEGDAEALSIYAEAYSKDPEFYRFWKTLRTYDEAVDKDTTFILSLDTDYFRLLGDPFLKTSPAGTAP